MASLNSLPTVTANISLVLSVSVSADIQTHWLSQRAGSPGTLQGAMGAADNSFTYSPGAAPASGLGFVALAAGQTVLIDGEAMLIESVEGSTVSVTRNVAPLALPAAEHAGGADILLLRYPDPWKLIADEALRPWAQQVVTALGAQSATFGAMATGSLTLTGGGLVG
jgi:hypothetical protein